MSSKEIVHFICEHCIREWEAICVVDTLRSGTYVEPWAGYSMDCPVCGEQGEYDLGGLYG